MTEIMRELYNVAVRFMSPEQGVMRVAAESPEHAKELTLDLLKDRANVEIVDVHKVSDIVVPDNNLPDELVDVEDIEEVKTVN